MSLRARNQGQFDEDEDLIALRLAALQTLKISAPNSCIPQTQPVLTPAQPVQHIRPRNEFRGGMRRGRGHMRNGAFHRHHVNPNLIAIVPINETPSPSAELEKPALKGKPSLVVNNTACKLVLPQDRYCKTEEVVGGKEPEVPTKFNRFEHSSSESSGEESEEEPEVRAAEDTEEKAASEKDEGETVAAAVEAEPEMDPDVLLMEADDEDESLEKLMNEMEEEMGLGSKQAAKPTSETKSARKNLSNNPTSHRKTKSTSPKLVNGEKNAGMATEGRRSSPNPGPSPQRPHKLRSHSRSPHRLPPSRGKRSRSLSSVRSPGRLRSPSPPMRSSRSPRRKYSPNDRYLPPRSPRRDALSRSRRALSPRSPSPRLRRSPRRSPRRSSASRWLSPRRQSISPKFRRQSVSPASRHALSPRARRSVSPRRPSPISYRKRSPSPARRNQSPPPRRYSPPRRNPSPPRRRVSHSSSRSPVRRRSPPPVSRSSGRKVSPWTPVRQGASRVTPSPKVIKRKSISPCVRGRKGSLSPDQRLGEDKKLHRGDARRPLQESRVNNIRKSCSPPAIDALPPRSPSSTAQSPTAKSWSCTSSLSLSPSPERSVGDTSRRVKSPLRIQKRRQDFNAGGAFQDNRSQSSGSAQPSEEESSKLPKRRKVSRSKSKKMRNRRSNESKAREKTELAAREAVGENKPKKDAPSGADGMLSVLEARRRKFESVVPIESSNKRIRLRKSDEQTQASSPPAVDRPLPLAQVDELERLLDRELENAVQLWMDDDSDGEKEGEALLKAAGRRGSGDAKASAGPVDAGRTRARAVHSVAPLPVSREEKPAVREEGADRGREPQAGPASPEEGVAASRDGDLRAELSRRRAERLTKVGSVHETMPARLVQHAFKDAVGKKRLERRERRSGGKQSEAVKGDGSDGRRVLVLKSAAAEQQVPSISVTIPKEEKHKRAVSPPAGKLPIHMRLGLATGAGSNGAATAGGSGSGGRRRANRKVKLKRSVLLTPSAGDKVKCGSSLSFTLGSMLRHGAAAQRRPPVGGAAAAAAG